MNNQEKRKLVLPKIGYGPICMRILMEFADHHKIKDKIELPETGLKMELSLARIFDMMLMTMGEDKRDALLDESIAYYRDLPPSVR